MLFLYFSHKCVIFAVLHDFCVSRFQIFQFLCSSSYFLMSKQHFSFCFDPVFLLLQLLVGLFCLTTDVPVFLTLVCFLTDCRSIKRVEMIFSLPSSSITVAITHSSLLSHSWTSMTLRSSASWSQTAAVTNLFIEFSNRCFRDLGIVHLLPLLSLLQWLTCLFIFLQMFQNIPCLSSHTPTSPGRWSPFLRLDAKSSS